jgi:hypothetical protein
MKRIFTIILFLFASLMAYSQGFDDPITKGSVLVYNVTEGSESYKYTVTVVEKTNMAIRFNWATNEAKPRKGTVKTGTNFFDLMAQGLLVKGFIAGKETLDPTQMRIFTPVHLKDMLMLGEMDRSKEQFDFKINNKIEKIRANYLSPVGPGKFMYNGKEDNGFSQEFVNAAQDLYFTSIRCGRDGTGLLSFYKDKDLRMELESIKLPD